MTIYIDANFILQAVLQQEEFAAVTEMYWLIESKKLALRCPGVAFVEAMVHVSNRNAWRANFQHLLQGHQVLRDLGRSGLHLEMRRKVGEITEYLEKLLPEEENRLDNQLDRIFRVGGTLLPILPDYYHTASQLRRDHEMRYADSQIAAAVLFDLYEQRKAGAPEKSVFVSADRGFAPIRKELEDLGCNLTGFRGAVAFVKHQLDSKEG